MGLKTVRLPPEILDMILDHTPTKGKEGRETLIACALVATWWAGPSQRRLFSSVSIDDKNYPRWMNDIVLSESKTRLLQYIRSLRHCCGSTGGYKYSLRTLSKGSGECFSALHNVRSLELANVRIEHLSKEELHGCFSAFRETLTSLALRAFVTSFAAFVSLIDYFPNITALQLGWFELEPDEGPVPQLSQPLRGKISIHPPLPSSCYLIFIDRLAKLDQEYEELVIDPTSIPLRTELFNRILQFSTGTVKCLRLLGKLELLGGEVVMISHFRKLRELQLMATGPNSTHEVLLSSITSTELRKVIFPVGYMYNSWIFTARIRRWAAIDKRLCDLVTRLGRTGYCHTLEVEVRFTEIDHAPGKYEFTQFLPEFRKKGVVTIIDAVHDLVLHSSVVKVELR